MKKGNIGVNQLFAIVIFIVLLAIIFLGGLYGGVGGAIDKFLIYIGVSNPVSENSTKIEILRYDILQDSVQRYNGVDWLPFPNDWSQKVKIGSKKISHADARYYLADNYYYKRTLPEKFELINYVNNNMTNQRIYQKSEGFSVVSFNNQRRGSTVIEVFYNKGVPGRIPSYYLLTLNDELKEADENSAKQKIGYVEGLNSAQKTPSFVFTTTQSDANIAAHINSLKTLPFPLKKENFIPEQSLVDDLYYAGSSNQISVNSDYVFKKNPGSESDKIEFQLYHKNAKTPVTLLLQKYQNGEVAGELYVPTTNIPSEAFTDIITQWEQDLPEKEIIAKVSNWRDSVLKKPAYFKYESSEINEGYFCVEKYGNNYLVVDLTKPVQQNAECNPELEILPLPEKPRPAAEQNPTETITKTCDECGTGIFNACDESECLSIAGCHFTNEGECLSAQSLCSQVKTCSDYLSKETIKDISNACTNNICRIEDDCEFSYEIKNTQCVPKGSSQKFFIRYSYFEDDLRSGEFYIIYLNNKDLQNSALLTIAPNDKVLKYSGNGILSVGDLDKTLNTLAAGQSATLTIKEEYKNTKVLNSFTLSELNNAKIEKQSGGTFKITTT